MMKNSYTPSVNIIRDAQKELNYIVTENAEKSAIRIFNDFKKGFHAFNIIGSYGTGKSSFLWALNQTVSGKKTLFDLNVPNDIETVETINIVGDYQSLVSAFNDVFGVEKDFVSNQKLFDKIYQNYEALGTNSLLIIAIDEFGKFLEFAAQNSPEKEMYFIQQLAEFVNAPNRNILLLTTLHQGVDTYAYQLTDTQKNEWRKVKGRFQEIAFNEPVEQLLNLASKHFIDQFGESQENQYSKRLVELQKNKHIFSNKSGYFEELKNTLNPLDIFSAYILTLALQRYGQNERSLFSFLQDSDTLGVVDNDRNKEHFTISSVYNYLLGNFYQLLTSKVNPDYSNWNAIKDAIQRTEVIDEINYELAEELLKTIGLLSVFASKSASLDDTFLAGYLSDSYSDEDINATLQLLAKEQIIRFSKFNKSYKLFEGTDLDIEDALIRAENQVADIIDIVPKLKSYFDFPIVTAKANSYTTGTPRLFEYELSRQPVFKTPSGEIDGYINLIFNTSTSEDQILEKSENCNDAIIYGVFKNTQKIVTALFDIDKTEQVLKTVRDDRDLVAIRELEAILKSNRVLLNHYVLDSLYNTNDVNWYYKGKTILLSNKKEFNKQLSNICEDVYSKTPTIKNELFNKHKPSAAIATARKNYFNALVNNFSEKDLGFDDSKFPPEKTIYYTLLEKSGIHYATDFAYTLGAPDKTSDVYVIWQACENFLENAKAERKNITELIDLLTSAPYKLKQGVVDFWVPTFLFIRRGDYALYSEGKFKPYINEQELYLITRVPHNYALKSFELNDLRLSFFNKYRELLNQSESNRITVNSFIESIRPILISFKELTSYAQKTNRLSKEALNLRKAIQMAQDPEKLFFDEFPEALGFNVNDLLKSETHFDDYIYKFQTTLEEIQNAYQSLLNRIEAFIQAEIVGRKCEFETYKNEITKRFKSLKGYQLLPKQKTFLQRVNSPLNDRDSWLASIGQVLIGKPLTTISDKDENVLQDNFKHIVKELDNLSSIENLNYDQNKEEVFKLDFTSKQKGLSPHLIRIPKGKLEKVEKNISKIDETLGKDKKMRIAILAKLLKNELEND